MAVVAAVSVSVLAGLSGTANAQPKMPPTYEQLVAEGAAVARRLCSTCHVTGAETGGTATVGVPSFRGIAVKPGQTAQRLRHTMINPHPPMPDVQLSNPEIERLIAYIDSLRPPGTPPLVPRDGRGSKPVYPDPS